MISQPGKLTFYFIILVMVIIDSALLSSPNLLGKIGLIIYRYSYLRTFPRTLITVMMVTGVAATITEAVQFMVVKQFIRKKVAVIVLVIFMLVSLSITVKTIVDFSGWTYSHTGFRFRIGAYLLPIILLTVFTFGLKNVFRYAPLPSTDDDGKRISDGDKDSNVDRINL